MITQAKIKKLINYAPLTGICKWINCPASKIKSGTVIDCTNKDGYIQICIDYKTYLLHRIIFLYMEGRIPKKIDHENNVRYDNRWSNLREATTQQNNHNQALCTYNKLGIKGLREVDYGYRAQVKYNGKKYSKRFKGITEESKLKAIQWLEEIRSELHKEYANNG